VPAALEDRGATAAAHCAYVSFPGDGGRCGCEAGTSPSGHDGKGRRGVTSGAYGHSVRQSLAARVHHGGLAGRSFGSEIEIIGEAGASLAPVCGGLDS